MESTAPLSFPTGPRMTSPRGLRDSSRGSLLLPDTGCMLPPEVTGKSIRTFGSRLFPDTGCMLPPEVTGRFIKTPAVADTWVNSPTKSLDLALLSPTLW